MQHLYIYIYCLSLSLTLSHLHFTYTNMNFFIHQLFSSPTRLDNPTTTYLCGRLCSYQPQSCPPNTTFSTSSVSLSLSHITHTHTHTVLRLWVQLMNRGASAQLLVTALLHLDNSIANLVVLCVLVPVTRGVGGPGRKTLGEVWKRQICCFLVVRWLREDNVEKFPINIIWKWYSVIDYFDLISCCHFFIISYSILSLICYHIVLYNITIYSVLYTEYIIL